MPWYRFEYRYGPGHMGTHVRYDWWPNELGEEEKHDLWHEGCDPYWDWPMGECEKVDELPEDIRQEQIKMYRGRIEGAKYMLGVLGAGED